MNEISNKDQLREMVSKLKDDYVDNTEYLREAKNSVRIRNDLLAMERLKRSYGGDIKSDEFAELCKVECSFLYNNYMHIFNKLLKDVLDLKMMFEFLQILQSIEEGQVNQEEASVIIGKKLKEMYIDSAIREGEQLDEINQKPLPEEGKCISWKQYSARQTNK